MYEKYYRLKDRPFTIVPNPGCMYMSSKHKLAFAHLQYGLMEGTGFVVLTGGIGTGKTTLIRFLLGKIQRAMDVAVVFNTNVSGAELLRLIIREFEIGEPGEDKAANLAMLNDFLIERFRQGRSAIVIIDEAQNLSREALEEVRLLSNLQGSTRPLLQIVLAGQPELRRTLADPSLTQLAQRITSTFHLGALGLDEAREYIHFRLTRAGGNPELFDEKAVEAIHQASGGVPRIINIMCNSALVHGFADELPVITAEVVAGVVAEMGPALQPGESEAGAPSSVQSGRTEPAAQAQDARLRIMEDRLQTLDERLADRETLVQLLQLELAVLKDRLGRLEAAPAVPAAGPELPEAAVLDTHPEPETGAPVATMAEPVAETGAAVERKRGVFGRFREFVFGV